MKTRIAMAVVIAILFCSVVVQAETAGKVFELTSISTVVVLAYDSKGDTTAFGSGVVLSDGVVATNCHVIEDAVRQAVRYREQNYPAVKKHTDWDRDVCTLTVYGLKAPAVKLGSTKGQKVGKRVYAVGAPKGLELTLSEGIISSLRSIEGGQYIQTTAPISPGSSGGGLFDRDGRLLGLVSFYLAEGQNLNFALPVEWISELPGRHAERPSAAGRSALISGRYRDNSDGTVTDTTTGLQWMRCALGQTWHNGICTGEAQNYNWTDAMAQTGKHRFADHGDWRLPSLEELHSLIYCSSGRQVALRIGSDGIMVKVGEVWQDGQCEGEYQRPAIDLAAFPNTAVDWFWSSSPYAGSASYAWLVLIGNGYVHYYYKNSDVYNVNSRVRLVRAGQ